MDQEKEQPVCPPHLSYVVTLPYADKTHLWPISLLHAAGNNKRH